MEQEQPLGTRAPTRKTPNFTVRNGGYKSLTLLLFHKVTRLCVYRRTSVHSEAPLDLLGILLKASCSRGDGAQRLPHQTCSRLPGFWVNSEIMNI